MQINKVSQQIYNTHTTNELIFGNFIDQHVKAIIMPYHIIQTLFLFPKFNIHNNIIDFNKFTYYFIRLIFIILFTYIYVVGADFKSERHITYKLCYFIQVL